MDATARGIDVGILAIVPAELDALLEVFGADRAHAFSLGGPLDYWHTSIGSSITGDKISVVLSFITGDQGNVEAAISTTAFLTDWAPKLMCLVGIAAGLSGRTKICDVIVPNKVHDRSIKVFSEGRYQVRGTTYQRHDIVSRQLKVRAPAQNVALSDSEAYNVNSELVANAAREVGLSNHEIGESFEIQDGSLVCDNVLIRDSSLLSDVYFHVDEKCRGGEMEGAGFIRACGYIDAEMPWLISRGISDFGDDRKNDDFHQVASFNACYAIRGILENCLNLAAISPTRNARSSEATDFEAIIIEEIQKSFDIEAWEEVCRLGELMSRALWLSGKLNTRRAIGEMVDQASAYCGKNELRSLVLIDDLGWTNYKLGNKPLAEKNIHDGVRIAKEHGFAFATAKGMRHLAAIRRSENNLDDAEELLAQASVQVDRIGDETQQTEISASLKVSNAKILIARGQNNQALELLNEANRIFSAASDTARVVKVISLITEVVAVESDPADLQEALSEALSTSMSVGRVEAFTDLSWRIVSEIRSSSSQIPPDLMVKARNFAARHGLNELCEEWKLHLKEEEK